MTSVDPFFKLLTAGVSFDKRTSLDHSKLQNESNRVSNPSSISPIPTTDNLEEGHKDRIARQEKVNHFRKQNRIRVTGTDVSEPIESWKQLVSSSKSSFSDDLLANITARYETPTPIQMQAIPLMMDRRELIACAPTGSGKTAAYLVPLIHHLMSKKEKAGSAGKKHIRSIILCPTRELAQQVLRECMALMPAGCLKVAAFEKADDSSLTKVSSVDLLITVPNRVVYLLREDKIKLNKIEWLVVDESDKLFEIGERGFRDQLASIYRACSSGKARRALFSATFANDVEEWCKTNLDNVVSVTVGERNTATKAVDQELLYTGTEKGKLLAFQQLVTGGKLVPPVLVFVQTKDRAKELYEELTSKGSNNSLHVDAIHSEKSELQRDRTVRAFRSGQVWVLICTELLGRGIDFKGVNLVINYDFPPSTVSYIHRIGRTGRAGRRGKAITFFTDQDKVLLRSIAHIVKGSGGEVPDYMLKLKKASRQEKRKLAKSAVKRASISTESKYDKEKREKLDAMIKGSKNRKRKAEQRAEERKNKIQTKAKKQKIQEEGEPSQGTPKPKKKKKKQKQSEGEGLAAQKPKKKKKKTSAS